MTTAQMNEGAARFNRPDVESDACPDFLRSSSPAEPHILYTVRSDSRHGVAAWFALSRAGCALVEAHFLEKVGISRVVPEIFQKRIGLDLGQSRISLFVRTLQPFKRLV
jgi:hypothetical protein